MQSDPQSVYATNLKQSFGYPLRNPGPRPDITGKLSEPNKSEGLQIGDIGHINQYGQFILFFNVKYLPNELSDKWKFPPEEPNLNSESLQTDESTSGQSRKISEIPLDLSQFDRSTLGPAFDCDRVFMKGVTQDDVEIKRENKDSDYIFTASHTEGAILILPDGAKLLELDEKYLEHIENHIRKYAADWCKYAKRDSLYLVTAVYKAKSWILGSFQHGTIGQKIHVYPKGDDSTPGAFKWKSAFQTDSQQAPRENTYLNQAVLLKGFKITVRDRKLFDLECMLERTDGWFARTLKKMRLKAQKLLSGSSSTMIEYLPRLNLAEFSHPLDIVNRVLLDQNDGAELAVTHDNDWIDMVENGLLLEDLMKEDHLREHMTKTFKDDLDSEHRTVCLRRVSRNKASDGTGLNRGCCEETGSKYEQSKHPHVAIPEDNSRLVITHMRLEGFDVTRIDVGVCVLIKFGNKTWRTNNVPHANVIEWDDVVTLPTDGPVHFVVYGTFQLSSTLGTREISERQTIHIADISRAMSPGSLSLRVSFGPRSSLLITLERHFTDCETHIDDEENSEYAQTTIRGFENFYCYQRGLEKERLDSALECFKSVLQIECDLDAARFATARFNVATIEFLRCQVHGTYTELDKVIKLYREILREYREGHPDRPATLLLLAQALLSRHGTAHDEFALENIEQLLVELPLDDNRYHQSADAILATCRFYRAINTVDPALVDVQGLLGELKRGAYTPPYGYSDRPHLSHKLGVAFLRRFQSVGSLDDLDQSIELNTEAFLQVPDEHNDKTHIAAFLAKSLLCGLEARGELGDVDTSITLTELGEKVIAMVDNIACSEGASAPSEDLEKQIDVKFAVTQLRGLIKLTSNVERLLEQEAADACQTIAKRGPSSNVPQVEHPAIDWTRDKGALMECKRQLGVLSSFLQGEGDHKMRQALEEINLEWPYQDHKIVTTVQALEKHMPSFYITLATRLRFVMKGWS